MGRAELERGCRLMRDARASRPDAAAQNKSARGVFAPGAISTDENYLAHARRRSNKSCGARCEYRGCTTHFSLFYLLHFTAGDVDSGSLETNAMECSRGQSAVFDSSATNKVLPAAQVRALVNKKSRFHR